MKDAEENSNIHNTVDFTLLQNRLFEKLEAKGQLYILSHLNPKTLVTLLTFVMSTVDTSYSSSLSGNNKKQVSYSILQGIINNSTLSPERKKYLLEDILANVFDGIVENIIDVSRKRFDINRASKAKFINFFKKFISSCIKQG